MDSLTSALNWYHKKIGAYDKELWEKSVDRRILRGVCAIPKKSTRIKTELIDVDLVRGSAFAKAKPKHSWISATIAGMKRVFLMPFFFSWWKVQTNFLVSSVLVLLYFLQIGAFFLYFSSDEKELSDVPILEILTPAAMLTIVGIILSQIVATFTSKKSRKHLPRDKRRRVKSKISKSNYGRESKSSPESASEADAGLDSFEKPSLNIVSVKICDKPEQSHISQKSFKSDRNLRFSFEDDKAESSNEESGVVDSDSAIAPEECLSNSDISLQIKKFQNLSEESQFSHISADSAFHENGREPNGSETIITQISKDSNSSLDHKILPNELTSREREKLDSQSTKDDNVSSDDELFIARKSSIVSDQLKNCTPVKKNKYCLSKLDSSSNQQPSRRYSDGGLKSKFSDNYIPVLPLQIHRLSVDNILSRRNVASKKQTHASTHLKNKKLIKPNNCSFGFEYSGENTERRKLRRPVKLAMNIQNFSSSCESGADTTSPNTPSQPQVSDSEWPLITNTDCNSDSTDSASNCSEENSSDISPSENPFAWEIQEPSKKLSNVGYTGSDKVSCTIWEHNECKKADLTALDISSAIIHKVDSSKHSTEYLYIGVFFSILLSLLPLLYRLRNGVSVGDVPVVATDILTMTVPTSEEVVKITDGFLFVILGSNWRAKLVVLIVMLERFILSLAYFFLLSVAEKTFTQRFLYAKHFCYLTSSRRAKRSDLPHFRLNKVRNIKIWLSIRSYLKKLGPQRSVDVIVSITFILEVSVVSFLCIQFLKEAGQFTDQLYCWELSFWTLTLGFYLLRFMVIGTKINKKYRNLSVLITEQINLYLHMEQKPHKKEELILANNVLKLAADLLKELESPFKISGLCANSYLYNITKVIVLSAFSAMLTDVLGFKLKLYKIKLK